MRWSHSDADDLQKNSSSLFNWSWISAWTFTLYIHEFFTSQHVTDSLESAVFTMNRAVRAAARETLSEQSNQPTDMIWVQSRNQAQHHLKGHFVQITNILSRKIIQFFNETDGITFSKPHYSLPSFLHHDYYLLLVNYMCYLTLWQDLFSLADRISCISVKKMNEVHLAEWCHRSSSSSFINTKLILYQKIRGKHLFFDLETF